MCACLSSLQFCRVASFQSWFRWSSRVVLVVLSWPFPQQLPVAPNSVSSCFLSWCWLLTAVVVRLVSLACPVASLCQCSNASRSSRRCLVLVGVLSSLVTKVLCSLSEEFSLLSFSSAILSIFTFPWRSMLKTQRSKTVKCSKNRHCVDLSASSVYTQLLIL